VIYPIRYHISLSTPPPSHPGTVCNPHPPIQSNPSQCNTLPKLSKLPSKSGNPMQGTASAIDRAYLDRRYIQPMPHKEYSRSGSRWSIQSAPPTHPSIYSSIHSSTHRLEIAGYALVKISWHVCRSDILNWPTAPLGIWGGGGRTTCCLKRIRGIGGGAGTGFGSHEFGVGDLRRKIRSGSFRGAGGIGDRPREAEIGQLAVCRRGGGIVGKWRSRRRRSRRRRSRRRRSGRRQESEKKGRGGRCGAQTSCLCLYVCRVVLSCLVVFLSLASCYHGTKLSHRTTNMQEIKLIISTYSI